MRLASAVYGIGLRLLLRGPGRRFAPRMVRTFRAVCRAERRRGGRRAVLWTFCTEIADVALTTLTSGRRDGRLSPRPATESGSSAVTAPGGKGSKTGRLLDGLRTDLRGAQRVLRRRPGFSAAAVATLAVVIGATTSIFTLVDTLLLRPLPFPEPEELVEIWATRDGASGVPTLGPAVRDAWLEQSGLFESIEIFDTDWRVLVGEGEPEQLEVTALTPGLLSLIGARPRLGRPFDESDVAADAQPVALLSDGLWRRRFGGDPEIIGETLRLDDTAFVVVGVMPRGFGFPDRGNDVWLPHSGDAPGYPIGRLADGLDVEAARQRLGPIAERLQGSGLVPQGAGIRLYTLDESFIFRINASTRRALWVIFAAVALLLAIGAANVANLMLSQGVAREAELGMRAALGASRGRITRQLVIEGALLGFGGGAAGTLIAAWGVRIMIGLAPQRLSFLSSHPVVVETDARALAFALTVAIVTTVLVAALPAARAARPDPAAILRGAGTTTARRQQGLRAVFVVAQVAIAGVLLVGAGLLARSLASLLRVDPGFDTSVNVVRLAPSPTLHSDPARWRALVDRLEELDRSLPGVERGAVTTGAPPWPGRWSSVNRAVAEGQEEPLDVNRDGPVRTAADIQFVNLLNVTEGYFETMGIPILDGRGLTDADADRGVVVISEEFARRFWHGESPVGRRLKLHPDRPWLTVVGVASEIMQAGLDDRSGQFEVYSPMAEAGAGSPTLFLVLRADAGPEVLGPAVRQAIGAIDPALPVQSLATFEEILAGDLAPHRFNMILVACFATVALLLAAVGIYGVLAYSVVSRTREIGVRMALGAERLDVLRRVVVSGMRLVALGAALATFGAWGLTRFIRSLLYEIEPLDPPTLVASALGLTVIALVACCVPALRAIRVDPLEALRAE